MDSEDVVMIDIKSLGIEEKVDLFAEAILGGMLLYIESENSG